MMGLYVLWVAFKVCLFHVPVPNRSFFCNVLTKLFLKLKTFDLNVVKLLASGAGSACVPPFITKQFFYRFRSKTFRNQQHQHYQRVNPHRLHHYFLCTFDGKFSLKLSVYLFFNFRTLHTQRIFCFIKNLHKPDSFVLHSSILYAHTK